MSFFSKILDKLGLHKEQQQPAAPAKSAAAVSGSACAPNCTYKDMVLCFPQLGAEDPVVVYHQSTPIASSPAGLTALVGALQQAPQLRLEVLRHAEHSHHRQEQQQGAALAHRSAPPEGTADHERAQQVHRNVGNVWSQDGPVHGEVSFGEK